MISNKQKLFLIIILLIIGVVVSVVHFQIMNYGPGTTGDSLIYLRAARNHHNGIGFIVEEEPLIVFPPVYPGMLSLVSYLTEGDVFFAGRILSALFFGVNLVLFTTAVLLNTDWNLLAGGSAILMFLFTKEVFMIQSMIWSEAPFITLLLVTLLLLSQYLQNPTFGSLLLITIAVGLAMATRYIGLTLLPPIVISILYFGNRSLRHKLKDSIILVSLASIPLIAWILRNYFLTRSTTNHPFAIHLINRGHIKDLVNDLHDFILLIPTTIWNKAIHLFIISTILFAFFIILQKKDYLNRNKFSYHQTSFFSYIIFSIGYILFLLTSISFFDASIEVNARFLLPSFLVFTLASFSLVWYFSKTQDQKSIWYSFILFIMFSVSINSNSTIEAAIKMHDSGRGYSSRYWLDSEIIQVLKDDTDNRKIYTNGHDVIWFLLKKEVSSIPKNVSRTTNEPYDNYEEQIRQVFAEVNNGTARIIYFNRLNRWELPTIEELESVGNWPILEVYDDGVILAIP